MSAHPSYRRIEKALLRAIHSARVRVAKAVYPGEFPRVRAPGRAATAQSNQPPPAVPKKPPLATALDVDLKGALAFFEPRRSTYQRLVRAVAPYIANTEPIFDVGANIGYFTGVLGEEIGLAADAHLFEPIANLAALSRQYLRNAKYPVHVHAYGLGDRNATSELRIATSGNLGWNTLVTGKAQDTMVRAEVPIRRFEEAHIDVVPGFIKIDVEGAEHLVLRGLLPALHRYERLPVILCEVGWGPSHPDWDDELRVFEELTALGYEMLNLDHAPLSMDSLTRTTDVLFVPADRSRGSLNRT